MARNRDGLEDFDNKELLILIPVDHINRCPSWNPYYISTFHVKALSLLLPHHCNSCSPCSYHIKQSKNCQYKIRKKKNTKISGRKRKLRTLSNKENKFSIKMGGSNERVRVRFQNRHPIILDAT